MKHLQKKIAILADDFTGAVDTGIKFAEKGARVLTFTDLEKAMLQMDVNTADVFVINTQSRHLSGDEAYQIVYQAAEFCRKQQIDYLYKKTDSVLRGNLKEEIKAALAGFDAQMVHFVPAYPEMGRYTRNAVQYLGNIPIKETPLGKDPFDPISSSCVNDFFDSQDINTKIHIHDAETNQDLLTTAKRVLMDSENRVFAGCAGFAQALAQFFYYENAIEKKKVKNTPFFVLCGSVNPVSRNQIFLESQNGYRLLSFIPKEFLTDNGQIKEELLTILLEQLSHHKEVLVWTDISKLDMQTAQNNREAMAKSLGKLAAEVADQFEELLFMIIGGDTVTEFLEQFCYDSIFLIREVVQGAVLMKIVAGKKIIWLISKSGGFGEASIIHDIKKEMGYKNGI